eukprot:6179153-Pleurochrysis_carterae.AAC.3
MAKHRCIQIKESNIFVVDLRGESRSSPVRARPLDRRCTQSNTNPYAVSGVSRRKCHNYRDLEPTIRTGTLYNSAATASRHQHFASARPAATSSGVAAPAVPGTPAALATAAAELGQEVPASSR